MILPPIIETERLTLRPPRVADYEPYAAMLATERGRHMGGPFTADESHWDFHVEVSGWILHGFGLLSMEDRESGSYAGFILIQRLQRYPETELAWMVGEPFEGRGVAFEAAMAARRYLFETRGWSTVVSYIDVDNARSIALAGRLGAVLDEDAAKPGEDADCLVYRHTPEALAA